MPRPKGRSPTGSAKIGEQDPLEQRLVWLGRDSRKPLISAPGDAPRLLIRDVLERRQRRLRRALRHVGRNPRKLHRLRLRIKESRYLDEIFGSLLTTPPDRELESLRQLQNRLGEFHDNWRLKKWLRAQPDCRSIAAKLRVIVNTRQARLLKIIARLSLDTRKKARSRLAALSRVPLPSLGTTP